MSLETIAVTGGNGKVGEATLAHLSDHGYEAVNVARGKQREAVSDGYLTTDLLDAGEVYGSIARSGADAVVHMGTIPGPQSHPGHVTFESNVMSSWNVLEAATRLGLDSVVLASSVNVMGAAYQDAPTHVEYLPVDEAHPLTPRDPYALGKHAIEVIADGYGRRPDAPTLSSLRYPWVATSDELRAEFVENDRSLAGLEGAWHHTTRDTLFSYLHVEDGVAVARLAAEADHDGHESFWAVAADTTADAPSSVVATEYFPGAAVREPLDGRETLVSVDKARELLGWEPERSWTDL
jgi:nucleoside-diphosphate-sugar epimerase